MDQPKSGIESLSFSSNSKRPSATEAISLRSPLSEIQKFLNSRLIKFFLNVSPIRTGSTAPAISLPR